MKNKILNILLVLTMFLEMIMPSLNVFAATLDDQLYMDESNQWWVATLGFSGKKFTAQQEKMVRRRSDGRVAYCIQPQIRFINDSSVHGVTDLEQMLQMSGLSAEQIERVTLISYYGYGYENHTTPEWYYATQLMIWNITKPGWVYPIADGDMTMQPSNRYDSYYNEINSLVDKHAYTPSFQNQTVTLKVGETATLNDTNNVLEKYYTSVENSHYKAEIKGNQLVITAKTAFSGDIVLGQKENANPPMIYSGANQLVFPASEPNSKPAIIKLESLIEVKGQKFFGSNSSGVYEPEANAEFEVYNVENNTLIGTFKTDIDGNFSYEFGIGTYRIHQVKGEKGHKFIKDIVFTVDENSTKKSFVLKNEKIATGTLEFTKEDISTGDPLPNTLVEIYDEDDELVFSGRTDENGKIVIPELEVGHYKIYEREAPEGYVVNDKPMDFEIKEDGEIVKSVMKDEKIKSKVHLHKTDQDGKALAGVVFGLYDENGNLIEKYTTDKDGNIDVELEYGKYYFQEISTIEGYELNTDKIEFEIKENGKVIEKSLVNNKIEQPKQPEQIVEVPNTFKDNNYLLEILVGTLLVGGVVLIVYGKKRK